MGVGGQHYAPAALSVGERPSTHCIEGWVGPRAGLYGRGKSRPGRDLIPGGGATPTTLSRHNSEWCSFNLTNASGLQQRYCIFGRLNSTVIRLQNVGPRNYLIRGKAQRTFSSSPRANLVPTQLLIQWIKVLWSSPQASM